VRRFHRLQHAARGKFRQTYREIYIFSSPASDIILPVSKLLQKKELDIFAAIELIDSVLDILRQNRKVAKTFFIKYLAKLRMNVKKMMLHY